LGEASRMAAPLDYTDQAVARTDMAVDPLSRIADALAYQLRTLIASIP
jgi:hypothetical protein